ncbi:MAG: hypothetical protein LBI13_07600 [Streptococcaceae bacterium]|jgi:hypothetical protein|nr:hypothetical protein [Streptococcaceae bacterium]
MEICKNGQREEAILYLASKGLVGLKDVDGTENVFAYPEIAYVGLEVLVLVTAVAVIAPTIFFTIRETESHNPNTTLYTAELNYCMEIISKFGSEKFSNEMYKFFIAIENGDRYVINRKVQHEY